jgi:hypothetical protein
MLKAIPRFFGNTLLKKLARTSAFSLSVVVFLSSPSSDLNFSSDIPVLVFLHMNTKANNKARKHNYIPLDAKTVQKIKKKHRCWTRYRETGDKKKYQEYAKTICFLPH